MSTANKYNHASPVIVEGYVRRSTDVESGRVSNRLAMMPEIPQRKEKSRPGVWSRLGCGCVFAGCRSGLDAES